MSEDTKQHPFISYLEKHADDRAMLAELRRGLGRKPGEAPGMFPYIVPFVHPANTREEANLYMIASLYALHPLSIQAGNMGAHLRTLADKLGDAAATTRRFVQLLNQSRAALDTPLRQHVSLLKSQDVSINWHQLLYDLNYWSHDERFVQKRWAERYWRSSKN
jgi:CRISPR system Cascade subunit CasB